MTERLYHGGPAIEGDWILPPSETGAKSASDYGAVHVHSRERVYLTTDRDAALLYAGMAIGGRGWIYLVEPLGALEDDPDCTEPGLSFCCSKARILKRRKVTNKERQLVLRAMGLPAKEPRDAD